MTSRRTPARQTWLFLALGVIWPVLPLAADDEIIAFGDSITEGRDLFDEEHKGGYPGRLQTLLRKAGRTGVVVLNRGVASEDTFEGLARIDSVLAANPDANLFILMEGTNDVFNLIDGEYSIEAVTSNLDRMAQKAKAKGMDVLYSTVIPRPPWATDRRNIVSRALIEAIRDLTSKGKRKNAEPWEIFASKGTPVFDTYYFKSPESDTAGHPNAAGFELMAEHFQDKIEGRDVLPPTISRSEKSGSETELKKGQTLFAIFHESGKGIRKKNTYFTISGRRVDATVKGNKRRVELSYKVAAADLACMGRVAVHSEDRAKPSNVRDFLEGEFKIPGVKRLKGDVSGDCTVDDTDLEIMRHAMGSITGEWEFTKVGDYKKDKRIDGEDLAVVAKNHGRSKTP